MSGNMKRRVVLSVLWTAVGLGLILCGILEVLDSFWSGMGAGLALVGVVRLVQFTRYRKDENYRKNMETEEKDERNRFLSARAWAWAGYLFVLIAAVATIVLKLVGREELMMMASGSLCLLVLLYWISYMILRRKY